MPEDSINPFNPVQRKMQRTPDLGSALRDAHGRHLNRQGGGSRGTSEFTFNQFVSGVIDELEAGGNDTQAKHIRDWRAQEQGGTFRDAKGVSHVIPGGIGDARREEADFRSAQADGALSSGLGIIAENLNPFDKNTGLGSRAEQIEQAKDGSSFLRDSERLLAQGVMGFADVASLGTADVLTNKLIELRQKAGLGPRIGGRDVLRGIDADSIRKGGEDAAVQDLDASGVAAPLSRGFRAAGELVGFFTPAGYISRAGNILKVAPNVGRVGSIVGRALQNPIINFIAAEALISEGEIRSAELRGDQEAARNLREGQTARLANSAAFAAFTPVAKIFGRIGQNGLLRLSGRSATNAKLVNSTLSQLPNLWQKARAVMSHTGGKAAEFVAFGFAPNVYRPGEDGKTEMSPWFTTLMNPSVIADAAAGKGQGRERWVEAMTDVLEHGVSHAQQGGVTGAILGILGAKNARLGEKGEPLGFADLVKGGPRGHTDPGEQAKLEGKASRRVTLNALREVRATLPPEQRRALKEALQGELENHPNPESLLQQMTEFVAVSAAQQKRILQENGALPKDLPTLADGVRTFWEKRLGTELFQGKAKDADSASTGVKVEVVNDPDRPGQPGRVGEVLETFPVSPPDLQGAANPEGRQISLSRVRYEDGTLGLVDSRDLAVTGTPAAPGEGAGNIQPRAGQGEAAARQDKPGDFGRVTDKESGAVGTLIRAHTDPDTGRRLVDVEIGGEQRTFDADRFEIRKPNQILEEVQVGTAAEQGPTKATPEQREKAARDRIDAIPDKTGPGFLNRLITEHGLTETQALQEVDRLVQEGHIGGEDAQRHHAAVKSRYYAPGQKAQRGRGGNVISAYKALRRRFFAGEPGRTGPRALLGKMDATLKAMSPAQRERALRDVDKFLPHEKEGDGLDLVLDAIEEKSPTLGAEKPAEKAPESPPEKPDPAGDKPEASEGEAGERGSSLGETGNADQISTAVTTSGGGRTIALRSKGRKFVVPKLGETVPKGTAEGKDRRAGDAPANETLAQRRARRLLSVKKGLKEKLKSAENRRIEEAADPATGMVVGRRAQDAIDAHVAGGGEVLYFDGDNLKSFNTAGAARKMGSQGGGDAAIRHVGKAALDLAKGNPDVATIQLGRRAGDAERPGALRLNDKGDEFIILPTSREAGERFQDALRAKLASSTFELAGEKFSTSVTFGRGKDVAEASQAAEVIKKARPSFDRDAPAEPVSSGPKADVGVVDSKGVFRGSNGDLPQEGQPITVQAFHGTGRESSESVYEPGADGPALGPGRYSAATEAHARQFGPNVSQTPVTIRSPAMLNTDADLVRWAKLGGWEGEAIPGTNAERVEMLRAARSAMERAGHDGAIVNTTFKGDFHGDDGGSFKRLREIFGEAQAIEFDAVKDKGTSTDVERARREKADTDEAPDNEGNVEELGSEVEIRQEGTSDRIPGQYALVNVNDLLPSHNPGRDFEPNKEYPKGLQPRDYQNDPVEQDKVREITDRFDPAEVANTAPRASEGPPSVAYDKNSGKFVVLNGNGRAMGMMEALKGEDAAAAYLDHLERTSLQYGLEAPGEGQALVRVVPLQPHGEKAQDFARIGNKPGAQRQQPIDRAAAETSNLTNAVLDTLNADSNTTVAAAINGPAGSAFRQALRHRLGRSGNDLFNKDGTFTATGKEFAEGMLALRAGFTPSDLRSFSPTMRRSMAASTMQLLQLRQNSATRGEAGEIRDAVRFIASELEGGKLSLDSWNDQTDMFGRPGPKGAHGTMLVEAIQPLIGKPRKLRDAFAKLVSGTEDAPGQGLLGGDIGRSAEPLPFVDRVAEAFDAKIPETTRAVASEMEESAAQGMPEPRNPVRRSDLLPEHQEMAHPAPPDTITGAGQGDTPVRLPLEGDPRPEFADTPPLAASKIVQAARDFFSVPILVGGTGSTRKRGKKERVARAMFDSRGRVIRLTRANDLPGLFHEVGHGLEKYLENSMQKDRDRGTIEAELLRMGKEIYPDAPPWNGWQSEGWAEFVRLWVTDPRAMQKAAPKTAKWFDKNVEFGSDSWRASLDKLRDMATEFVGQGAEKRVTAFRSGIPNRKSALQELKPSNVAQKWIDQGAPILKFMRKLEKAGVEVAFENNPGLARESLDNSHHAKAKAMAEDGMIDFAGNKTGPALKDAIELVGRERYDEVVNYLVAKNAETMNAKGIESGVDPRDVETIIDKYRNDPKIQAAAKIVWDWHRGVLTYMKQAGALTEGEVKAMKEAYPFYIPNVRIKDKADGSGSGASNQGPQRRTGSGREIADPIAASVAQASNFIRWAHSKNMQMRLANLADAVPGMGQHVRLAEPGKVRRSKPLEDFEKELQAAGIDTKGQLGESRVLDWLEARTTEDGDVLFPVKRGDKEGGGQNIVWYEASPEFYKAVTSSEVHRFGPVMDLLVGRPARLKRLGTTGLRPGFAVVNLVRDFYVGFMQSGTRNPLTWSAEWTAGQGSALKALFGKEDGWMRLYRSLGVEMSRQLSLDKAVREKLGKNLGATTKERLAEDVKNFRVLRLAEKGIDGLRDLIGVFEAGPRIAEMRIQAKKLGIDPRKGMTVEQSMRLARAGRQVTVDFNAAGTSARAWNAAVPFFNVAIQGPRRMIEAYNRDRMGFTVKALASITAPTLALWFANKDEDWYIDMPWWEKNAYWHIGKGIRIPRPFEVGTIFASMPEAAFDAQYRKDPRALMEALSGAGEQFTPDFLPVLGREARDWLANEDSFTNAPIVPRIEEGLEEREQFGPQTTNVARALGDALNISPRKIDHAIRGIGGGVFGDTARAFGTTGGGGGVAFNPLDRFRRRGGQQGSSSQAVQDFFDMRGDLQKKVRSRLDPASPAQRQALRIMERAGRKLKKLRGLRQELKGESAQAGNLKEMRAIARAAIDRARKILDR